MIIISILSSNPGATVSAEPCLPVLPTNTVSRRVPTPPPGPSSRPANSDGVGPTVTTQPPVATQSMVWQQRHQTTAVATPTNLGRYGYYEPAIMYPQNFSGNAICPNVRFKNLAFYDVLGTLLQPSILLPSSYLRSQKISFSFNLTQSQIMDMMSQTVIEVQLRFCLMETSNEQDVYFPPCIQVRVNYKPVTLPVSSLLKLTQ